MSRRVPNFLYIGPDKSGSTWLAEVLRRHPQCFVPPAKDLYFFDRFYYKGWDWYGSYFEGAPADALAVGELSHDYLFSVEAAERIRRDLPDVKLITSLRDPVQRTFSHYLYLVRSGLTRSSFADALDEWPELTEKSMYGRHLSVYARLFPAAQLRILLFDDLQRDAESFARDVFTFLGVDFVPGLPYHDRVLPASRPRSSVGARALKSAANIARSLGFANAVGRAKRSTLLGRMYVPYEEGERPRATSEENARLASLFADDLRIASDVTGLDLSCWITRYQGPSA